MMTLASAIVPIFLLILLGSLLRLCALRNGTFWQEAERLVYFVMFPALLIDKVGNAAFPREQVQSVAAATYAMLAAGVVLVLAVRPLLRASCAAFSSVFQGTLRHNTYIGFAAAGALYGEQGTLLAALLSLLLIPVVNLLSVLMLVSCAPPLAGRSRWRQSLASIARNPLILAIACGALWQTTGRPVPLILGELLAILGRAALPLALLCVGAGLRFEAVRRDARLIATATLLRLGAMPACAWLACSLLGLHGPPAMVLMIFSALPTSASSFVLARQMNGDHRLMATVLTVQTCVAIATFPLILALVTSLSRLGFSPSLP